MGFDLSSSLSLGNSCRRAESAAVSHGRIIRAAPIVTLALPQLLPWPGRRQRSAAAVRLLPPLLLLVVAFTAALWVPVQAGGEGSALVHGRKAIVNGQAVHADEQQYFPFYVALFLTNSTNSDLTCGGSIIAPSFVLTAAHCFSSYFNVSSGQNEWELPTDMDNEEGVVLEVVAGTADSAHNNNSASAQRTIASHLWMYPDYVELEEEIKKDLVKVKCSKDFAIVKLAKPLVFSDSVRSVALSPDDSYLRDGADLTVTGLGSIFYYDYPGAPPTFPAHLQVATVNYLPSVCDSLLNSGGYKTLEFLTADLSIYYDRKEMICAGCEEGGTGACSGDSGGPLFALSSQGGCPVQVGVSSFILSEAVCGQGSPDLYARVSYVLPWIEHVIKQPARSTVALSPTHHCQNCLANDFPRGRDCEKASRYNLKLCDIQARLASSFTLTEPECAGGKQQHTLLKAYIDFSKGFADAPKALKKELTNLGHVVFLHTDKGTGNGVIGLRKSPSSTAKHEMINTPLNRPKVLAEGVAFDAKKGAWVYRWPGCSSAKTYAALYVLNADDGSPKYRQISIAVGKVPSL